MPRADRDALPVEARALDVLVPRGYHEAITYSFVDPALQASCSPGRDRARRSATRSPPTWPSMRASLWPGLIEGRCSRTSAPAGARAAVRIGRAFRTRERRAATRSGASPASPRARRCRSSGARAPDAVDFFDVKADVEALLARTGAPDEFRLRRRRSMPCLHPGRSARIAARRQRRSAGSASCTPNSSRRSI